MNPLFRAWPAVVAACLFGLAAGARAADDKPIDSKALDRYLYTSLRFVINHGVDLYNRPDDPRGAEKCYQHFRQSLEELVPVLSNHPDLQKAIKDGLDKAEKDPEWRVKMAARAQMPNPQAVPPGDVVRVKAFALRAVFNDVRTGLNPEPPKAAGLWDRLGGEKGVRKILDDFAELVGADPKADITRGGKRKLDELTVADLKQKSLELISEKTGGPLKYTGRGLKPVHQGMGITDAQFDAAAADFKKALLKNQVNPADADALMRVVEATRKDIVEGKGAESPKGDGATVKGRVTVGGKPLAKGKITLTGEGGKAITDAIEADGSYTLENVPAGSYKVTVTGVKDVPAAFTDAKTTPTTANVNKGMNLFDLELPGAGNAGGKPEGKRPREVPDGIKTTYVSDEADKKSEKGNGEEAGNVSGKVTYKGLPLPAGTLAFHPRDGKAISAKLGEDGAYSADKVPPGEYAVTVETDSVKPPAKYVKIPKKYTDPKTSGLKYTAVKGKQAFDIVLED